MIYVHAVTDGVWPYAGGECSITLSITELDAVAYQSGRISKSDMERRQMTAIALYGPAKRGQTYTISVRSGNAGVSLYGSVIAFVV